MFQPNALLSAAEALERAAQAVEATGDSDSRALELLQARVELLSTLLWSNEGDSTGRETSAAPEALYWSPVLLLALDEAIKDPRRLVAGCRAGAICRSQAQDIARAVLDSLGAEDRSQAATDLEEPVHALT